MNKFENYQREILKDVVNKYETDKKQLEYDLEVLQVIEPAELSNEAIDKLSKYLDDYIFDCEDYEISFESMKLIGLLQSNKKGE